MTFIYPTKTQAKRLIWRDLKRIDRMFDLGVKWNNVELTGLFPNGSMVYLNGAETEHDIDKFRGAPFDLVCIDESASWTDELLDYLIEEVIVATLRDRLGTIVIAGTPGPILIGDFYKATSPEHSQVEVRKDGSKWAFNRPWANRNEYEGVDFSWSFHSWTVADNTGDPQMWEKTLADKRRWGWTDDTPKWVREGLGKWMADSSGFVFSYSPTRNDWEPDLHRTQTSPFGLPEGHDWFFVFGVDLGYDDDFDLEVFAFADTCRDFYHVDGWSMTGMDVTQSIEAIERMLRIYKDPLSIVCDSGGGGRQIFQEFLNRGLKVTPAQKGPNYKRDLIELFNTDLRAGRCRIRKESTLGRQMQIAQWDEKKRDVDARFANHAIDAAIYVRQFCMHHWTPPEAQEKEIREGSAAWYRQKDQEERRATEERRIRERDLNSWGLGGMTFEDSTMEGWH